MTYDEGTDGGPVPVVFEPGLVGFSPPFGKESVMKVALYGASGIIGQRILNEALSRRHTVTAVVRDPSKVPARNSVQVVAGNVLDPQSVAATVTGHDAVITAFGPSGGQDPQTVAEAARALVTGLKAAGVKRLVVVGGAGSLEVAPGVKLIDTPQFPAGLKPIAQAHSDALDVYRRDGTDLDWTYLSPAALIEPGERTGQFRLGGDQLLTDAQGQSRISAEDYAIALLDEVETPKQVRQRFTVAY
jgi:putative NADH-flavin reductase